jgi:exosortase
MFPALSAVTLLGVAFGFLYGGVILSLIGAWTTDDNYSHGFLIVPVAVYLVWERREVLASAVPQPSVLGLGALGLSVALLVVGQLGAELFLTRVSLIGSVAGTILFCLGWQHLRVLFFPLAFLLLMVPIPAIVFNQIAFPLQIVASQTGEAGLRALDIPVLREGNIIELAKLRLEVADACSGIRSLVSLLTLGIVFGYFNDSRLWVRFALALATVPLAILSNGMRVAGTGVVAHFWGADAAFGFMHTFSGWLVFVVALLGLLLVQQLIAIVWPDRTRARAVVPSVPASALSSPQSAPERPEIGQGQPWKVPSR